MRRQNVDRLQVERRAAELQPDVARGCRQLGQKAQRQLPASALPVLGADTQDLRREQAVDTEELELDGGAADPRRLGDQLPTASQVAVVVAGDLGDEFSHGRLVR